VARAKGVWVEELTPVQYVSSAGICGGSARRKMPCLKLSLESDAPMGGLYRQPSIAAGGSGVVCAVERPFAGLAWAGLLIAACSTCRAPAPHRPHT
jgi:hypothetical protein